MRPRSKKTAKLYRDHKAERAAYVARVWLCECCCKREATDCHEITPAINRLIAFGDRAFWLAVCTWCNQTKLTATGRGDFPLARQLALKKLADPDWYDRERVLTKIGAPLSRVTETEVDEWIKRGPRA